MFNALFSVQCYFIRYFEGIINYLDAVLPLNLISCDFIEEKIEQGCFLCREDDKENTKNEHTPPTTSPFKLLQSYTTLHLLLIKYVCDVFLEIHSNHIEVLVELQR